MPFRKNRTPGTSPKESSFDNNVNCHELFRVIYNGGALNGNGVKPQGIITAYDKSVVSTVAPTNTGAADVMPEYGTTCGVDQNI